MRKEVRHRQGRRLFPQPRALLFCLACLAMINAVAAEAGSGTLAVTATVVKRATLQVLAQPASVLVTDADLARGYVEVPAPVQVAVQSNSPAGYMLVLAGQHDFVREVLMSGLDSDVQVGAHGGMIPQRSAGRGVLRRTLELKFRFVLAKNAQRGEHPWPLQLSVAPL
jgi:hypothetical protein